MFGSIFWHSFKKQIKAPLFLGVGYGLLALLFAALFDEFKDQLGAFVDMIPSGMEAVIGDIAIATTPEGWLALELFPLFVVVGMAVIGVVIGANILGQEEDSGTIELLLSSAKSRTNILLQKYIAFTKLMAIPVLILSLTILISRYLFGFRPDLGNVLMACVSGWALGLLYGSISFATQAVSGRRGLAIVIGVFVFGLTYALTIVSKLVDELKDFEIFSPIYYYNIPETLTHGLAVEKLLTLILIAVLCLAISIIGFRRRDIGI